MPKATLEDRVEKLEASLQKVQEQLAGGQQSSASEQKRGWRWFVGIFADSPDFEEAVRIGKEWRNADRPETDAESA